MVFLKSTGGIRRNSEPLACLRENPEAANLRGVVVGVGRVDAKPVGHAVRAAVAVCAGALPGGFVHLRQDLHGRGPRPAQGVKRGA